jgi:hypothetical protein
MPFCHDENESENSSDDDDDEILFFCREIKYCR